MAVKRFLEFQEKIFFPPIRRTHVNIWLSADKFIGPPLRVAGDPLVHNERARDVLSGKNCLDGRSRACHRLLASQAPNRGEG